MEENVTAGGLLRDTLALVGRDLPAALLVIAGIVAATTFVDVTAPNLGNLLGIPIMVTQFYWIRRLIDRNGLRVADTFAGFGSFFVLGLITGIPTVLGYLLLIVPGIYLSARWVMSDAALLAENAGSSSAATRSWEASRGHVLQLSLAMVALWAPQFVGFCVLFYGAAVGASIDQEMVYGATPTLYALDALVNLLIYASQVLIWYFGVAAYALIAGPRETQLQEVFA